MVKASTNNEKTMGIARFLKEVIDLAVNFSYLNLVLATLTMKHDELKFDLKIAIINIELQGVGSKNNVHVLPLHDLPHHLFFTHGLHPNERGTAKVVNMVLKPINKKSQSSTKNSH